MFGTWELSWERGKAKGMEIRGYGPLQVIGVQGSSRDFCRVPTSACG